MTISVTPKSRSFTNGTPNDAAPVDASFVELYNNDSVIATAVNGILGSDSTNGGVDGNFIVVRNSFTGTPINGDNCGLKINRGASTPRYIQWNEQNSYFELTKDGTNYYQILDANISPTLNGNNTFSGSNTFSSNNNSFTGSGNSFTNAISIGNASAAAHAMALGQTLFNGSPSGYVHLPVWDGGALKTMLIQWVTGSTTSSIGGGSNASVSISWPVTFPNSVLMAVGCNVNSSPNLLTSTVISKSTTGCTVNFANPTTGGSYAGTPGVIAVGY